MSAFGGKADMTGCGCLLSRSLLGVKRTWAGAVQMSAFDPKRTSFGFLRSMLDFGPTRCWHPLGQKFEKGPLLAQVRTYHVQVVVTFPNTRNQEFIPCSSGFDFGASSKPCFGAAPRQGLSSRQHTERTAATRLSLPRQRRTNLCRFRPGAVPAAGTGTQGCA